MLHVQFANNLHLLIITFLVVYNQRCIDINAQQRIVGGTTVTSPNTYPFYAFPKSNYLCGATLIWGDILVTAAHCGALVWSEGVWLGGTNRDKSGSVYYNTSRVIVHPRYNSRTNENDVALIQIKTFITDVPYAKINFNTALPAVGSTITAIGYGRLSEGGSLSQTLQQVDLIAESYAVCSRTYYINDSLMLCNRGLPKGGKDTCQGDSGGPLFLKGTTTIAGLVSFGNGCARASTPAVNTRVSGVASWIQTTICSLGGTIHNSYCSSAPVPVPVPVPASVPVPAPVPVPVPVPVPILPPSTGNGQTCLTKGTACKSNRDCCRNKCSPAPGGDKTCK